MNLYGLDIPELTPVRTPGPDYAAWLDRTVQALVETSAVALKWFDTTGLVGVDHDHDCTPAYDAAHAALSGRRGVIRTGAGWFYFASPKALTRPGCMLVGEGRGDNAARSATVLDFAANIDGLQIGLTQNADGVVIRDMFIRSRTNGDTSAPTVSGTGIGINVGSHQPSIYNVGVAGFGSHGCQLLGAAGGNTNNWMIHQADFFYNGGDGCRISSTSTGGNAGRGVFSCRFNRGYGLYNAGSKNKFDLMVDGNTLGGVREVGASNEFFIYAESIQKFNILAGAGTGDNIDSGYYGRVSFAIVDASDNFITAVIPNSIYIWGAGAIHNGIQVGGDSTAASRSIISATATPHVDQGAWNSATAYGAGDIATYEGLTWQAAAANTNQAPAGPVWDSAHAYVAGDKVLLDTTRYQAVNNNTNSKPSGTSADWNTYADANWGLFGAGSVYFGGAGDGTSLITRYKRSPNTSVTAGAIGANSTVDKTVAFSRVRPGDDVYVFPASALPAGITVRADCFDNDLVTLRFANVTTGSITVGAINYRLVAWRHTT